MSVGTIGKEPDPHYIGPRDSRMVSDTDVVFFITYSREGALQENKNKQNCETMNAKK